MNWCLHFEIFQKKEKHKSALDGGLMVCMQKGLYPLSTSIRKEQAEAMTLQVFAYKFQCPVTTR
jgi:hypothetical protein